MLETTSFDCQVPWLYASPLYNELSSTTLRLPSIPRNAQDGYMIIWARPMFSALLALSMWLVHCLSCAMFYGHLRSFFWSKRYLALLLLTWLLVCSPVSPAGGRLFLGSQTHQGPCQLLLVLICCCPCSKPGTPSPIPSLPYSRSWSPRVRSF